MLNRILTPSILKDLDEKIVILSGPRQCGKTTLSKMLFDKYEYLNFDSADSRKILSQETWSRDQDLIIFDELHKMKKWKSWLKGVYDTQGVRPRLLVTGSARMNQFKKAGDSLAGRHFNYTLHPFDLKELKPKGGKETNEIFETLLTVGGFPEPFLKGQKLYYNRWATSHIDLILRQDLLDLEVVRDIKSIEILISLLAERVGSSISVASLARHLQRDPKTVARWLNLLEDLFVVFRVMPFHKNLSRAIRKEPKFYFYDTAQVLNDRPIRFENLVACALRKELDFLQNTLGHKCSLSYLRTKEGREIDFLIIIENVGKWLIEAKIQDAELSQNFKHFESHFKGASCLQLVAELKRESSTKHGHRILHAPTWLSHFSFIE